MAFKMDLSNHVKGIAEFGPQAGLMEALLEVYEVFRDDVQETAPRFRPWIHGQSRTSETRLERLAQQGDHTQGEGQILYLDEVLHHIRR
jgi:hypothetical protein